MLRTGLCLGPRKRKGRWSRDRDHERGPIVGRKSRWVYSNVLACVLVEDVLLGG